MVLGHKLALVSGSAFATKAPVAIRAVRTLCHPAVNALSQGTGVPKGFRSSPANSQEGYLGGTRRGGQIAPRGPVMPVKKGWPGRPCHPHETAADQRQINGHMDGSGILGLTAGPFGPPIFRSLPIGAGYVAAVLRIPASPP